MSRRVSSLAVVVASLAGAVCGVGCTPAYDVVVGWTLDGEDPAEACGFLPDDAVVRVTADSREKRDERFPGATSTTTTDHPCGDGSGTIQVGNFADVLVELVAPAEEGGDDTYGTGVPFEVNPGASSTGYSLSDEAIVSDIRVVQGTLHANFTVVGRGCTDAGAGSFNVDLFENTEPLSNVLVADDVVVDCVDNKAEFVHSPVHVDARYRVVATTEIGGTTYRTTTEGEGIEIQAANTFSTIDLSAE